ncbi:MAG: DUF4214 domain-containing protein [Synechococcaceae cyanobacterium SM1_2_3]|nr:DUF4214 domain-containing protein [Synechococcaceae cyanobacterium SM1_2_3]
MFCWHSSLSISFILLILLTIFSLPIQAATYTVTNLNDSGAGSLRQAVLDANANADADTIVFSPTVTGIIKLTSGELPITHAVTITGPGASVLKVSGNNASRIFNIASGASVDIEGLTLQEGSADNGGAIYNNGSVTLNNSQLLGNKAAKSGGGLYNNGGTVKVNSTTVSDNVAVGDSSYFPGGGGICSKYGIVTVSNSALFGNSTGAHGGAIQIQRTTVDPLLQSSLTVFNSTLSGNSAGNSGGGITNVDSILTITNSTVSGNLVGNGTVGYGGGIDNTGNLLISDATVLSNTVSGNSAGTGGGFFLHSGFLKLGNSVVAGNAAKDGKEIMKFNGTGLISQGHNLFGENGSSGLVNANPIASDKILSGAIATAIVPLANNGGPTQTHLPVAGSVVINAGDNSLIPCCFTHDQRGFPRIEGGTVDIGAVEGGSLLPDQTLIERYYQAILGRASDASGLAFWMSESSRARSLGLDTKDVFRVMANVFFTGAEYLSRNRSDAQYITDLYRAFFNRDPDSSAVDYWTQPLTAGLPRSVVLFSFLFSAEFEGAMQSLFGDTATRSEIATVGDFYRGFLNRLPDNDGFLFWLGRFRVAQCTNAAAVRTEVESISSQFLASTEYTNRQRSDHDFVADLYYVFLRRGGDVTGFNYWVDLLNKGVLTRDQLRQEFVKSVEFESRVTQIINQGCAP